jgi:hypothetical protein
MRNIHAMVVALFCAAGAFSVMADTIAILDTGVDNSGASLSDGAADPHWSISPPSPGVAATVSSVMNALAIANTSGVNWNNAMGIIPSTGSAPGFYSYSMSFSIDKSVYSSFSLSGASWADDSITAVTLGGNALSTTLVNGARYFSTSDQSLFNDGLNTLTLTVMNMGGFTGLLLSGSVNATAVPEASEWAMLIAATGLGLLAYRKQLGSMIHQDTTASA